MAPTPLRALLDEKVGDLGAYVETRRDRGLSWSHIALDLYVDTSVRVADETLRLWFAQDAA